MKAFSGWLLVAPLLIGPALTASGSGQTAADQRPATFRSSADVVTIQASVRDSRGRTMKGLKPSDFEVLDNGQLRPILSALGLRSPVILATRGH